jgi:hypothetical protein
MIVYYGILEIMTLSNSQFKLDVRTIWKELSLVKVKCIAFLY